MNYILEYWNKIQSGEIAACKRLIQQLEKLVDDIDKSKKIKIMNEDGEEEEKTFIFDEELASRPIEFIEKFCKHSKGKWAGKSIELELFQKAKFQAIFGFVDSETKLRRYQECLTIEGRKNGKSTEISGIGNFMLLGDGEGGAQIACVASKKDQARIVFNEAKNMVSQSPLLSKYIKKRKSDLYVPLTFSTFEPLASDSNTLDGLNLHCGIIDELHSLKDRNLYDVSKQSMSAREQPLLYMITTSGFVRECIYDDMYEYACKVLDGSIEDNRFLTFIYELDKREEWTNFKCWQKANPGLGNIKSFQKLTEYVEQAKNDPKFLPTVLAKDFNIRQNSSEAWIPFDVINNTETFDINDFKGRYCVGGVDLSSTTDLTCATVLFVDTETDTKYAYQHYWIPSELVERKEKEDKIPYSKWIERGLMSASEGTRINYSDVTKWFVDLVENYDIRPLYVYADPWNTQYFRIEMEEYGFTIVDCRQGYKTLSPSMKILQGDLLGKKLNYQNSPILKWCISNVSVKYDDNENVRPVKMNQRQRIDGLVSLLIAYVGLNEQYEMIRSMLS